MKDRYIKNKSVTKDMVNKSLAGLVKRYKLNKCALVLDGADIKSTIALKKVMSIKKIEIVNSSDAFKKIINKHKSSYNEWLGNYLEQISISDNKKAYSLMYLDYCGSLDGSKDCKPLKEIKTIADNELLDDNAVLALTFCWRNANAQGNNDIIRAIKEVEKVFAENGRDARVIAGVSYRDGAPMFNLIFQIKTFDNRVVMMEL